MHLIDRSSLLSPAALPLVIAWAKQNLPDGNYESWYNSQGNLTIIPLGVGDANPRIVGTVVPAVELKLIEQWSAVGITFFVQSELEATASGFGNEDDNNYPEEDRTPVIDEVALKDALRDMVRRSRDEAELRTLIAADKRFVGTPAISAPGLDGEFLSLRYTQIIVYVAGTNGVDIRI